MVESAPSETSEILKTVAHRVSVWTAPEDTPAKKSGSRLRDLLAGVGGASFATDVVGSAFRPDSLAAAAARLRRTSLDVPTELPWYVRSAVRASGAVAPVLPAPMVPLARSAIRSLVDEIMLDARPKKLGEALSRLTADGSRVEVSFAAGPAVGSAAAAAHRAALLALIAREDITHVSFRIAPLIVRGATWDAAGAVEAIRAAIAPLYEAALARDITLTLEVTQLAELTPAIDAMKVILDGEQFTGLKAGISLPAAVPESRETTQHLIEWAGERKLASFTIRLTDGSGSAHEKRESIVERWNDPAFATREEVIAAMIRVIDDVAGVVADEDDDEGQDGAGDDTSTASGTVRLGVASHEPSVLAYAAERFSAESDRLDLVMMLGVSPLLQKRVQADVENVLITAPAIPSKKLETVTEAIVERLDAAALVLTEEAETHSGAPRDFEVVTRRASDEAPPETHRRQDRAAPPTPAGTEPVLRPGAGESADLTQAVLGIARSAQLSETSPLGSDVESMLFGGTPYVETAVFSDLETADMAYGAAGFHNASSSDPLTEANRAWAAEVFAEEDEAPESAALLPVNDAVAVMSLGEGTWQALSAAERAVALERVAVEVSARRAELIVAAREHHVLFVDADRDVTTAIDYARYYAAIARELDTLSGAVFVSPRVSAVAADPADVIASTAEGIFATLAAGGVAVVVIDDGKARVAELLTEAVRAAGIAEDALQVGAGAVADALQDDEVDTAIMAGAAGTIDRTVALYPTAHIAGRVTQVNTAIITASADVDEAISMIVDGAFARGGAAFESTSLAILVGAISRSDRLSAALFDAVTSLRVGAETDAASQVGPLAGELTEEDCWALTTLEAGESWLVKPREVSPGLWTPGVRVGVELGSRFARERFTAPVLGIMHVPSLTAAIALHNEVAGGGVASLATTNPDDAAFWLSRVQAGSLVIGRSAVDPRVQRQPQGGWNASAVGTAAKAGGPNRLATLGSWRPTAGRGPSGTLHLRGLDSRVTELIESAQPDLDYESFDWVRRGALSDALVWDREFGQIRDVTRLGVERNLLRYRPARVAVRATAETPLSAILRVVVAAVRSQADFTISAAVGLPAELRRTMSDANLTVFVESDDEFIDRTMAAEITRVRLLGPGASDVASRIRALDSSVIAIYASQATTLGRVELLPFLREQSITLAGRSVTLFGETI